MMRIEFKGAIELKKSLLGRRDLNAIKTVVAKNGSDLQRAMMRKAVFNKGYSVGDTRRSIKLSILDNGMTAEVMPTTEYAPYLEVGTRFMEAQPFVRPALQEIMPNFTRDINKVQGK